MAALTLDNLISSGDKTKGRKTPTVSRTVQTVVQKGAGHEVRNVQVKAACRPSEKPVFEKLAKTRGETLSNFIYEYLVQEARKDGLID